MHEKFRNFLMRYEIVIISIVDQQMDKEAAIKDVMNNTIAMWRQCVSGRTKITITDKLSS